MATPIMLVEDNEDEIVLLLRALKIAGVTAPLVVVRDGVEAIEYLSRQGVYHDASQHPMPQFIVLDLKMPRLSGFGVLSWLRDQPGLRRLPVVVLTSSNEDRDVASAYDMGANSYLLKPNALGDLQHLARLLQQYWLDSNVRPPLQDVPSHER